MESVPCFYPLRTEENGCVAADLSAAAACESRTLDSVVVSYRSKVLRFALASLRDPDAAETVTQNCLLKAHRTWQTFRNECSRDTWIMKIAMNLIRDHARNRKLQFWRNIQLNSETTEIFANLRDRRAPNPEAQLLVKERLKGVWSVAGKLPEKQRKVFFLRFEEDLNLMEISAITGLAEGTVKVHLFRAVGTVRERIERD